MLNAERPPQARFARQLPRRGSRHLWRRGPRRTVRCRRRRGSRGRGRGDVELDRAGDAGPVGGGAGGEEAVAVELRLDEQRVEEPQDGPEEEPEAAVAGRGTVGDAAVGEEERDAAAVQGAEEVGPELGLDEDHRADVRGAERAADAGREVEREVDADVVRTDEPLADRAAGRARRREDERRGGVAAAQLREDLPGEVRLADGDGVDPDAGLLGEAAGGPGVVAAEALGEVRAVAAALLHAEQELRHHRRVGDREEDIVEDPAHGVRSRTRGRGTRAGGRARGRARRRGARRARRRRRATGRCTRR